MRLLTTSLAVISAVAVTIGAPLRAPGRYLYPIEQLGLRDHRHAHVCDGNGLEA